MTIGDGCLLFLMLMGLAALPSSSVALVLGRSASGGLAHGLATACGIALADTLFILLAALGLSVVATYAGPWFFLIKLLGGFYLIWLGYQLFTRPAHVRAPGKSARDKRLSFSLLAGFVFTLGDIKAIVFYASILPMVVEPSSLTLAELAVLVTLTLVAVGGVKAAYVFLAQRWLAPPSGAAPALPAQKLVGGALMASGAFIALKP